MSPASILGPADLPPPSTRRVPRSRRGDGWDALADIEGLVFAVEAELEGMDRSGAGRRAPPRPQGGPRPAAAPHRADLDVDLRRHAMARRRLALGHPIHHPAQQLRPLD